MTFNLRLIGHNTRHITSFEKNAIKKISNLASIESAELIYDDTLYDVDDKYYLLLNIKCENGIKVTTTTDGETQYEALLKAVELTKKHLIKYSYQMTTSSLIQMDTNRYLQEAV